MTDLQRRLADGIAAVVRAVQGHHTPPLIFIENTPWEPWVQVIDQSEDMTLPGVDPPPLSPLQSLALSVLIDPLSDSGSGLIDALIEAGVIDGDWEAMVRADERRKYMELQETARMSVEGRLADEDIMRELDAALVRLEATS